MRKSVFLMLVVVLTLAMAVPAFAAKGGQGKGNGGGPKGASGTMSLVLMDSTDGLAHHGQKVTFEVSASADRPFVGVRCWQGTDWVYDGYVGFFPTYMFDPWLTMDSPYWTAGEDATCTARLFYYDKRGREKMLATLDFAVAP